MNKLHKALTIFALGCLTEFLCQAQGSTAPAPTTPAPAEISKITFASERGWRFLPFYIMKDKKLVEKHAKELGVNGLTTEYLNYETINTPVREAFTSGKAQYIGAGISNFIFLADKPNSDAKALATISTFPLYFNTLEDVKSICDIKGKISVPILENSPHAVVLRIGAKKQCGNFKILDDKMVGHSHKDAMAMIFEQMEKPINENSMTTHFASPPQQYIELEKGKGKIKKLTDSYEILGAPASSVILVSREKFIKENPKVNQAVLAALNEAIKWINENKQEAAKIYLGIAKTEGETPEGVFKAISDKNVMFDSKLNNSIQIFADAMYEFGTIKKKFSQDELTMDNHPERKDS